MNSESKYLELQSRISSHVTYDLYNIEHGKRCHSFKLYMELNLAEIPAFEIYSPSTVFSLPIARIDPND